MATANHGVQPVSTSYRTYVLAITTATCILSYLDRHILGILLPSIKTEFLLQDWQLGLLTGPVFSLIFTTLTIPIAILADRTNRRNVIGIFVLFFSAATLACGYAASFWQLCAARFAVGIGEAGTLPATNSILSDLYPPEKRASAMAVYTSGTNIGLVLGFFGGGLIAEYYGWRSAFLIAGIPGIIIALLLFATVKEPERRISEAPVKEGATFFATLKYLMSIPAYRWVVAGASFGAFGVAGTLSFAPLFLVQTHGLSSAEVGFALAMICGVIGGIVTYSSGWMADWMGRRSLGAMLIVPAVAYAVAIPFIPIFYTSSNLTIALVAGTVPLVFNMVFAPVSFAMTQALATPNMRSQSSAVLITFTYLVGTSMGPLVVGFASDLFRPSFGDNSLPYALMLTIISSGLASFSFWRGYRSLRDVPRPAN